MSVQAISHSVTPPTANNETMILDSTRGFVQPITAQATTLAPGTFRNRWAGKRVRLAVKNGDQAITVNLLLMTAPTLTTNSAWEVDTTADSSGEIAIAASTTKIIDWLPRTSDWAIEAEMGATATSAITVAGWLVDDPTPSV